MSAKPSAFFYAEQRSYKYAQWRVGWAWCGTPWELRIVGRSVLLSPPEKLHRVSGAAAACWGGKKGKKEEKIEEGGEEKSYGNQFLSVLCQIWVLILGVWPCQLWLPSLMSWGLLWKEPGKRCFYIAWSLSHGGESKIPAHGLSFIAIFVARPNASVLV